MIFVTVGTHEQQFNRLIKCVDDLKKNKSIGDEVVIQIGYSDYKPQHCEWQRMFSYDDMEDKISEARIVVTHGGPSSFIMPIQFGKIPIVVPRLVEFNEHINNHQKEFINQYVNRYDNIIVVNDLENLELIINEYDKIASGIEKKQRSNNLEFNKNIHDMIEKLLL